MKQKKTLFFGYGNPDRGDDGAAYHIFKNLLEEYDVKNADIFNAEIINLDTNIDLFYNFQLLPEHAELISHYGQVIFIDAHTGEIEKDIDFTTIEPKFKYSPFTHHFAPSFCLAIVEALSSKIPNAWLLSIRGFEFGFNRSLSQKTSRLVDRAINLLKREYLR